MTIRHCIGLLFVVSSVGCVSFQDCEYRIAQNSRAHVAWWFSGEERCSSNPWSHYSSGWRQGYRDVLMGGDGRCPPVPPQHYWSPKYQNDSGRSAIENWFQGYRDGGSAAFADCGDHYNPIPMSDETRMCSPGCIPTDRAIYPYGRTTLNVLSTQLPAAEPAPDPSFETPIVPYTPEDGGQPMEDDGQPMEHEGTSFISPAVPPAPLTSAQETSSKDKVRFRKKQASSAQSSARKVNSIRQVLHREAETN